MLKLLLHIPVDFHIMRFQYPGISKSVAIIKHLFEMCPAKACLIRFSPYITFHIRGSTAQYKVHQILLYLSFNIAERTFIIGIDSIIEWYRIQSFFHSMPP